MKRRLIILGILLLAALGARVGPRLIRALGAAVTRAEASRVFFVTVTGKEAGFVVGTWYGEVYKCQAGPELLNAVSVGQEISLQLKDYSKCRRLW